MARCPTCDAELDGTGGVTLLRLHFSRHNTWFIPAETEETALSVLAGEGGGIAGTAC